MSEVINNNVFAETKKFVDISSLDYFWDKAKGYIDGVDTAMSAKVSANETAIKAINDELDSLSGGAGSIATQINNAIEALKLPETYEAKGDAAKAEAAAKTYTDKEIAKLSFDEAGTAKTLADAAEAAAKAYAEGLAGNYDAAGTAAGLNAAMDTRVAALEAIDHEALAADASAAAVATVLDGAPEKFDTLKEVAEWISNNESAASAADLVTRVAALEAIDHDAYVDADATNLQAAKDYADGKFQEKGNYEEAGAAAAAETAAKAYTDEEIGKLSFDAAGTAASEAAAALSEAKSYTDGKDSAMNTRVAAVEAREEYKSATVNAAIEAAAEAAKNAAIADAAEALKAYYTKTEVDNLLATNTAADQAYAKNYTDALFNSFKFAQNSDIDALFAE